MGCSGVLAQEKPFGKLRFQVAHLWYLSCPAEYDFRVKFDFFLKLMYANLSRIWLLVHPRTRNAEKDDVL